MLQQQIQCALEPDSLDFDRHRCRRGHVLVVQAEGIEQHVDVGKLRDVFDDFLERRVLKVQRDQAVQAALNLLFFRRPRSRVGAVFSFAKIVDLSPILGIGDRVAVVVWDAGLFDAIQLTPEAIFLVRPQLVIAVVAEGQLRFEEHRCRDRIVGVQFAGLLGQLLRFREPPLIHQFVKFADERGKLIFHTDFLDHASSNLGFDFLIGFLAGQVRFHAFLGAFNRRSRLAKR